LAGQRMDFDAYIAHCRAVGAEPYVVAGYTTEKQTGRTEAHGHSIAHGWFCALWTGFGFTLLAVFFVPFLPAWAKNGARENTRRNWN